MGRAAKGRGRGARRMGCGYVNVLTGRDGRTMHKRTAGNCFAETLDPDNAARAPQATAGISTILEVERAAKGACRASKI